MLELQRRALIAAVAAANRESAAFIGVLWIAVTTLDALSRVKRLIQGAAIIVAALSITIALRRMFSMPEARVVNKIAENPIGPMLLIALNHPFMSWAMLLIASLTPTLAVIGARWSRISEVGRRIIFAGLLVATTSLVIGAPRDSYPYSRSRIAGLRACGFRWNYRGRSTLITMCGDGSRSDVLAME